ncbi:hypothetical protein K439DRAFT_1629571 [Ramaria rubella]|nr:hypothetical protein K439DRAFT_1629571 [Ramaria rubella]
MQSSSEYGGSRSPTDTHTTHTTGSFLLPGAGAAGASNGPSSTSASPLSAKEREAYARSGRSAVGTPYASGSGGDGGMHVANQDEVLVHQDGGRVRETSRDEEEGEGEDAREIPPRYDSILGGT